MYFSFSAILSTYIFDYKEFLKSLRKWFLHPMSQAREIINNKSGNVIYLFIHLIIYLFSDLWIRKYVPQTEFQFLTSSILWTR